MRQSVNAEEFGVNAAYKMWFKWVRWYSGM